MKEQEQDTLDVENAVSVLEKSWEDAKSNVLALLGDAVELEKSEEESTEDVEKSDDGDADDTGKMEYNEEEDDEDEEDEVSKAVEDSIEEELEKSEDDVSVAMDAEPFLRQMVNGVDRRIDGVNESVATLSKAVEDLMDMQKATARMMAAYGDLQKSTAEAVEVIGNTPIPSGSVLGTKGTKFEKSTSDVPAMNKDAILTKALKLASEGKISGRDLTKLEGRVNRNQPIPESIQALLKEEA